MGQSTSCVKVKMWLSFFSLAVWPSQLALSSGKIMFISQQSMFSVPHVPLKYLVLVTAGNVMQNKWNMY